MLVEEKAINILDKAIRYVEKYGFDVASYGIGCSSPRCYIGTLNTVGGESEYSPHHVSSPELKLAFSVVDEIAIPLLKMNHPGGNEPGRVAEAYGFDMRDFNLCLQTSAALDLFREARNTLQQRLDAKRSEFNIAQDEVVEEDLVLA